MDGAVDGDRPARCHARQQTLIAVGDSAHVVVPDDAQADDVTRGGQRGGGVGVLRRGVRVRLQRRRPAGPQRGLIARVDDPRAIGPP